MRRLGVSGPSGGERPVKAQLVVALVALIILLAVPLYLWRRPTPHAAAADAGVVASAPAVLVSMVAPAPSIAPAVPVQPVGVRTNPLQRVRCGGSRARATSGETCDALPAIEHAFVEAVQKSADCAPKTSKEGTINHVLEVDFAHKKLHVFPGKSGDWHGPSARRTTHCVERALGKPDLSAIPHAHAYYALAVMATYPVAGSASPVFTPLPPSTPTQAAPPPVEGSAAVPPPNLQQAPAVPPPPQ